MGTYLGLAGTFPQTVRTYFNRTWTFGEVMVESYLQHIYGMGGIVVRLREGNGRK